MGFDVTFHPVSVADLQHFVFDLAGDGALAGPRSKELTSAPAKQREVAVGVLARLPDFVEEVKADGDFAMSIAFAAAAVAGYRHPYWYARGSAMSFMAAEHPPLARLFSSLPTLAKGPVAALEDDAFALLTENYSASGVVLPGKVAALEKLLALLAKAGPGKKPGPLFEVFDAQGYDSLQRAIGYALEHGLGLLEATDLVVPMANEGFTELDNLRAHFLKNVDFAQPGPPPAPKKVKVKVKAKTPVKARAATRSPAKAARRSGR
jgi:hypothetical protein